jgi:hypothetical protein
LGESQPKSARVLAPRLNPPHAKKTQQSSLKSPDRLLELANAIEADHAGRLSVAVINKQFREVGGSYEEYGEAIKAAIAHGWLTMHPSGGYVSFTQAGADLFA